MKTLTLSVIFTLLVLVNVIAQNYQSVYSNRTALFQPHYNGIVTLRIDSVEATTDSIFYPMGSFQKLDYDCYTPFGDSWIGKKIIVKNDGWNYFFNKNLDTIKIKTSALLNESWTAFLLDDSIQIIAKVIDFDTITFLSLIDSVKTIEFKTYDKDMNPLSYNLNSLKIKISKNYGFVRALNFYLFPHFEDILFMDNLQEIYLTGLINPKLGFQNLTWFDVFDFQPEDEIHVITENSSYWHNSGFSNYCKTTFKYLSKVEYEDSISYTYLQKQSLQEYWDDSSAYSVSFDTLTSFVHANTNFDKLPGEPVIEGSQLYYYSIGSIDNLKTKTKPSIDQVYYKDDSCWIIPLADDCLAAYEYIEGLGGPYFQCDYSMTLGGQKRELVYYKKGDKTWGIPLVITSNEQNFSDDKLKIFPNPATNYLHIGLNDFNSDYNIQIIDINGRMVLEDTMKEKEMKLNISKLYSGVYFVRITRENQIIKTEKLVISK